MSDLRTREDLVRRLAAKDSAIDLMTLDVVWTAEFGEAGWVKQWTGKNKEAVSNGVLPGPLKTATYQGKLYAAPFTSNTQLLWYRKDLVGAPPPNFTWQQMIDQAVSQGKQIQIQGARAESLNVTFNSLLELGFGSSIRREWAWRVKNNVSLANLQAFRDFAERPPAE